MSESPTPASGTSAHAAASGATPAASLSPAPPEVPVAAVAPVVTGPVPKLPPVLASTRVDRWTWAVRLFRTRALAAAACRAGHVKVNGDRAKPATTVRPGDEVRVRGEGVEHVVDVRLPIEKRVGAALVPHCLVDRTPPPPPRETLAAVRDRGAGRPTKRERREIDRLRGR